MKIEITEPLETDRLVLRKLKITDLEDLYEYASDDEVTKYLPWDTHSSLDVSKKYIQSVINKYSKNESGCWAIEYKENKKMIGCIDIGRYDDKNSCAEIGYVLNKNYWNKGIMTEALAKVVEFAFSNLNIVRLEIRHVKENIASSKVILKNGFEYEGTLRKSSYKKGKYNDISYYSIVKED